MAALEVEKFIAEELGEGGTRVDMYVDLLFFISPELTPILHFTPHVYCTYLYHALSHPSSHIHLRAYSIHIVLYPL